jgi:hypothetical protein
MERSFRKTWMEARIILKQIKQIEAQIKFKQLGGRSKEGRLW